MLIEFSVANYLSFHHKVTLSMEAAPITEYLDDNCFTAGKYKLLKSAAIYGANASGKSNLIKALDTFGNIVLNSLKKNSEDTIDVAPFLLRVESKSIPSFFEIILLIEGITYRYGFEATQKEIVSEWFFSKDKGKEKLLFIRNHQIIELGKSFVEGKGLESKTNSNALFLSVVDAFNGKLANNILQVIKKINVIPLFFANELIPYTYAGFNLISDRLNSFYKIFNLGFERIISKDTNTIKRLDLSNFSSNEFKEVLRESFKNKDAIKFETYHKVFDDNSKEVSEVAFDLFTQESEGTKKVIEISILIINAIDGGLPLIIDELDAKLHPLLTLAIIRLFNSKETNPKNSQLIFTTHDTNLLSKGKFRRDQIYFTEKDTYGATDLYSLVEYKDEKGETVRKDRSFEEDYLKGRYGAIPFIGDLSKILNGSNTKN